MNTIRHFFSHLVSSFKEILTNESSNIAKNYFLNKPVRKYIPDQNRIPIYGAHSRQKVVENNIHPCVKINAKNGQINKGISYYLDKVKDIARKHGFLAEMRIKEQQRMAEFLLKKGMLHSSKLKNSPEQNFIPPQAKKQLDVFKQLHIKHQENHNRNPKASFPPMQEENKKEKIHNKKHHNELQKIEINTDDLMREIDACWQLPNKNNPHDLTSNIRNLKDDEPIQQHDNNRNRDAAFEVNYTDTIDLLRKGNALLEQDNERLKKKAARLKLEKDHANSHKCVKVNAIKDKLNREQDDTKSPKKELKQLKENVANMKHQVKHKKDNVNQPNQELDKNFIKAWEQKPFLIKNEQQLRRADKIRRIEAELLYQQQKLDKMLKELNDSHEKKDNKYDKEKNKKVVQLKVKKNTANVNQLNTNNILHNKATHHAENSKYPQNKIATPLKQDKEIIAQKVEVACNKHNAEQINRKFDKAFMRPRAHNPFIIDRVQLRERDDRIETINAEDAELEYLQAKFDRILQRGNNFSQEKNKKLMQEFDDVDYQVEAHKEQIIKNKVLRKNLDNVFMQPQSRNFFGPHNVEQKAEDDNPQNKQIHIDNLKQKVDAIRHKKANQKQRTQKDIPNIKDTDEKQLKKNNEALKQAKKLIPQNDVTKFLPEYSDQLHINNDIQSHLDAIMLGKAEHVRNIYKEELFCSFYAIKKQAIQSISHDVLSYFNKDQYSKSLVIQKLKRQAENSVTNFKYSSEHIKRLLQQNLNYMPTTHNGLAKYSTNQVFDTCLKELLNTLKEFFEKQIKDIELLKNSVNNEKDFKLIASNILNEEKDDCKRKLDFHTNRKRILNKERVTASPKGGFGMLLKSKPHLLSTHVSKDAKLFLQKDLVLKRQECASSYDRVDIEKEVELQKAANTPIKVRAHEKIKYYHYILMDAGGMSLHDFQRSIDGWEQALGKGDSKNLFKSIFKTLATQVNDLHKQNIVHKDIKPANIVIHPATNRVSIIDFGISDQNSRGIFRNVDGSLPYVAPEVIFEDSYNFKVDVWSLGMSMAESLTPTATDLYVFLDRMVKPKSYESKTRALIRINKAIQKILDSIKTTYGSYSHEYHLLSHMLVFDPKKRFSMEQVVTHPYFSSMSKYSYVELAEKHDKSLNSLALLQKKINDAGKSGTLITHSMKAEKRELEKKVVMLQDAMKYHDLSSQIEKLQTNAAEKNSFRKQHNITTLVSDELKYLKGLRNQITIENNPYIISSSTL